MTPRVWAFTLAFNESTLIPYWVRHYKAFCDRVVVYVDTGTDDGTDEIAAREGADVRPHDTGSALDDLAFVAFAQDRYREARGQADYVIWVDADEILYHPRLKARLARLHADGVTYPQVEGYCMIADAPPRGKRPLHRQIRRGIPSVEYSKVCIFHPWLDVVWEPGKHLAAVNPADDVPVVRDDRSNPLKLLHYRWLGEEWHVARNARNYARLTNAARAQQLGKEIYPGYAGPYSPAWYAQHVETAPDVV